MIKQEVLRMKKWFALLSIILVLCLTIETGIPGFIGSAALADGEESSAEAPALETDSEIIQEYILSENSEGDMPNKTHTYSMYNGQKLQLKVKTSKKIKWSSSNSKIAAVNSKGLVTAKKVGTVTIQAKYGSKVYKAKITIKSPLKIAKKSITIKAYDDQPVKLSFYLKSGTVKFSVKDKSIVSPYWDLRWNKNNINLNLVGLKAGSTTVTVTNSVTKDVVKIQVKVTAAKPHYRALLIGERDFGWDYCPRNAGDVELMADVLKVAYGPAGTKYTVTQKINAGYDQIRSAIYSTFGSATENDVSLFFIATHGNQDGDGELSMPSNSSMSTLSFRTLASWLKGIKGKIIVILESCGAGSAIYRDTYEQNGVKQSDPEDEPDDPAAFTSAAVRTFAALDDGIVEPGSTGDLRLPKFYVLAAARHRESSWGNDYFNWFTIWLAQGLAPEASGMSADSDNNGRVTLTELFKFINTQAQNKTFSGGVKQHVQRYPVNSTYELFRIKK